MKTFEALDISGDAGIRAYGATLEEAFCNSAMGLYDLTTNPESIAEKRSIAVEVESHSLEGLVVAWLNELIFQFDAFGFIGKKVKSFALHGNRLSAVVSGEDFDADRHERRLLIKAATYHQFKIGKINGIWELEVIFDI